MVARRDAESVGTIPLFRVDVPTSSQRVGFRSQLSRSETNDHVELRKELRPAGLSTSEHLRSREVLKVLMVSNDINGS